MSFIGNSRVDDYITSSGAILSITSMVTGEVIQLAAFISDMAQSFTSNWNAEDVFGRNDPIATFQGTKRTISLSLDVPSERATDARVNLERCAKLSTFLYPGITEISSQVGSTSVKTAEIMSRPPLVKVEFGNIIRSMKGGGLLGYFDSYNFAPVVDAGMYNSATGEFYPKVISINLSFNVLHQDSLGQNANGWVGKKLPFG
jgi:hypothetical protein